ncbi:protein kinase domain-containing protein [Massilia cavernae]|uniref:Serine/threonine protein kinase n=1 Tax=Massilia cavernae TaxID=2320864 RepID=A0A418Y150_9BURK|nr:protein kinase [Massilia cavernae]RJG19180.1 serine/threonine protein kinase [Massilia cavernae]
MLQAGQLVPLAAGAYRLRRQLAGSSYGLVWQAAGPHGDVALKLVNRPHMARAHPSQRSRWIASANTEIAFLRSLRPWDERHIVRLLDCGEHDGLPVMALELLDTDLAHHLAREREAGRRIGLPAILRWLDQVNHALAKVHQYGWTYLDLKPGNVLLDAGRGRAKLADFGTSRARGAGADAGYAGTASWQAPEQFFPAAHGGYDTDWRSDYFALGALFYYLVTDGLMLRFCSDCGKAWREHQLAGARRMQRELGSAQPQVLSPTEAALFVRCIRRHAHPGRRSGATAALALLRNLIAAEPGGRPSHALQVARMIADIRAAAGVLA